MGGQIMKNIKKIVAIIGIICCLPIFLVGCGKSVYNYENAEEYSVGDVTLEEKVLNSININWVDGSVKIIKDENITTIMVKESSTKALKEEDKLRYLCKDGTLNIMYRESSTKSVNINKNKELLIMVPADDSITKKITIKTISASVEVNGIKTEETLIKTTSGNTDVINCCISNTQISSTSGKIKLGGGALFDLKITSVSGGIYAEQFINNNVNVENISGSTILCYNGGLPTAVTIQSTSGNVTVKLPETISGFALNSSTTVGIISCDFKLSTNNVFGDGSRQLNITTVSGGINIKKV